MIKAPQTGKEMEAVVFALSEMIYSLLKEVDIAIALPALLLVVGATLDELPPAYAPEWVSPIIALARQAITELAEEAATRIYAKRSH